MLTRNEIKDIRALARKRERDERGCFIAEGPKAVGELLGKYPCRLLAGTPDYMESHRRLLSDHLSEDCLRSISQKELERASLLQSPREVLALFEKPAPTQPDATLPARELCLALDGVQDPGNVGTIIRLADWYGINHLFCSCDTADAFAPKVVQATMGALGRVKVYYLNLPDFLRQVRDHAPVMGTFLDGDNLYTSPLPQGHGLLLMGSEGRGISADCAEEVSHRLLVPPYPREEGNVESLNVAVTTAVIVAELRRQHTQKL